MLDGIPTWSVTVTSWRRGAGERWHGSAPYTRAVFVVFGLSTKQQHLGPGETRTCRPPLWIIAYTSRLLRNLRP